MLFSKGDMMRQLPEGKKIEACRICGGKLIEILDLGFHPPSDAFLTQEQLNEPEVYYPLTLCCCEVCTLAQLNYIVPRETLFCENYPYETGVNEGGIKHFKDFADEIIKKCSIKQNDFVVDIGGNDGTFALNFENHGCKVLNIDPCGLPSIVKVWKGFWDEDTGTAVKSKHGHADIITATNVLAHTEDLHGFMKGVEVLLKDDGVFVIETPYLDAMIDGLQFDQIYHEHLSYFNQYSIQRLLRVHGMDIWDYEINEMHGGSLRIYAKKGIETILTEKISSLSIKSLQEFAEKVKQLKKDLIRTLNNLHSINEEMYKIVGIAASAKGNTLLNYCGFDRDTISWITDKSTLKQGKFTPGSHIRVYSDDILIEEQPEFALMLACNFKKNILKAVREKGYKGKIIIPYPEVHIE